MIRSLGECQLDKAAVPSLLKACDALLDDAVFGVGKAGISVFDDDFRLHARQRLMKFRDLVERVRDVSGVYLTGRLLMGHVDGGVNGAPFAGIVLTAGSVLRADDAAGPVLSKKMEDAPIAGWYTIDSGQTPKDVIEVKRERPPRLVFMTMPPTWRCLSGLSACSISAMSPQVDVHHAFASFVDSDRRD